ncbi:hypothetical protein H1S01_12745 [Heliobacterium chlorum]|uniref:Uncharacterized protein n=1 Tax=Heliobacterium chlorum TaxID=2698 RepID=A0ABR7T725_HELCL|nr:hypothetical protein [Heliobacterium chlorum]MBC9785376.1 hypothetical protein [Heliobacterium chlorum]
MVKSGLLKSFNSNKLATKAAISCCLLLFPLTGCSAIHPSQPVNAVPTENPPTSHDISSSALPDLALQKELEDYKEFNEVALKTMTEEQLISVAEKLCHYTLTVNDTPIPSDGVIEMHDSKIRLVLSQRIQMSSTLPAKYEQMGPLKGLQESGDYHDHLKILSNIPFDIQGSSGTTVSGYHYIFESLQAGSTIVVGVAPDLQRRLGLKTSKIQIRITV